MAYDAELISELGAKRFLRGVDSQSFSNISFFDRGATLQKKFDKCSFGCHGPSYRLLRKPAQWRDIRNSMGEKAPFLTGIADGIHKNTVKKIEKMEAGIERTAEGLYVKGSEAFSTVGAENMAVIDLASTVFSKMLDFDLDVMENPIMQSITVIINEYMSVIPEWVIRDMLSDGAIIFEGGFDRNDLFKAIRYGVVNMASMDNIKTALSYIENPAKRQAGKSIGKKLTPIIASAIATKVTKKILMQNRRDAYSIRRDLVGLRKQLKPATGGLAKALMALLEAQGMLAIAAKSSRKLQYSCGPIWNILRYKLHGCDMLYFLIEPMVEEYVDRLSMLEKRPAEFLKIMAALYKAKKTKQIFFPGMLG